MLNLLKKLFLPPLRWLRGQMSPALFGPALFPFFLILLLCVIQEMVDGTYYPHTYPQLIGTDCRANWDERCTNFYFGGALVCVWAFLDMVFGLGIGYFKRRFFWRGYLLFTLPWMVGSCLMD